MMIVKVKKYELYIMYPLNFFQKINSKPIASKQDIMFTFTNNINSEELIYGHESVNALSFSVCI